MINRRFHDLFGGPPRAPESEINQKYMNIAASIQAVTEEILLKILNHIYATTDNDTLCLAGGVALNCVANGQFLRASPFKHLWIQPAAGDAGGALGAALALWHHHYEQPRIESNPGVPHTDAMRGSYLGTQYSNEEICGFLSGVDAVYESYPEEELVTKVAELIRQGKVIGWFQGAMEFGPRALGSRSIIGDPRLPEMQRKMNLKIKYRESFRPFAPSVLAEDAEEYFDLKTPSPYMLLVTSVADNLMLAQDDASASEGFARLEQARSSLPAITHVDGSARVQTVHPHTNPRYYALLTAFKALSGCSVLINTSFNVRGEPIVNSPEDAWQCFMRTEMDVLVLENQVLIKEDQSERTVEYWQRQRDWQQEFELD